MTEKVQPRPATTVILLREANEGFEIFMTRRPSAMSVLAGMYVFPGGTVQTEDHGEKILTWCFGLSRAEAQKILGVQLSPELCLGHWVAGIRELFEEVGVLLCTNEEGEFVKMDQLPLRDRLYEKRVALMEESLTFKEFLESERLFCDTRRLTYFSHWQTPQDQPARFDTRFYLASLPADQTPLPTSKEIAHSLWITPDRALSLCGKGELPVIFPTYASLRTLADFDSLDSLFREYNPVKRS